MPQGQALSRPPHGVAFRKARRQFSEKNHPAGRSGKPISVVADQFGNPTFTWDLAGAVSEIIDTVSKKVSERENSVYHLVNEGRASRWTFARTILDLAGYSHIEIEKIAAAEFPRPSTPPEYSVLRNFAAAQLGITLRSWQDALQAYL